MKLYLIGSLRNPEVPKVAAKLRAAGHEVFDDWHSAGPEADDFLWEYEKEKGHSAKEALAGHAARNIFDFDVLHLKLSDAVVLLAPAGKSAFLELGWCIGQGKPGYILMDGMPERIDIMFQFATAIVYSVEELLDELLGRDYPAGLIIPLEA